MRTFALWHRRLVLEKESPVLQHEARYMESREPTILLVDDAAASIKLICDQLEPERYRLLVAVSGAEANELARAFGPDAILVDAALACGSGIEVALALTTAAATAHIPLLVVTAAGDREAERLALRYGASEVLERPVAPLELRARVQNLIRMRRYHERLVAHTSSLQAEVNQRTAQLRDCHLETVQMLTRAAEYKDEDTGAHVRRISYYASELARRLGMDDKYCDLIFHASAMHDVGKIAIPDSILHKQGRLEAHEWECMKAHTTLGAQMLQSSASPYVRMGAEIALRHHERWDGSGYPGGLKGEEIPFHARIMCVGDIYDALRSRRPYKGPYSHERACSILLQGDGRTMPGHFDPLVLAEFAKAAEDFRDIFEAWHEQEEVCAEEVRAAS